MQKNKCGLVMIFIKFDVAVNLLIQINTLNVIKYICLIMSDKKVLKKLVSNLSHDSFELVRY